MSTERRYTEAELNALFARAARRQEQARRADEAFQGSLTLAEAQRIGAEVGIDPAHIAAAAAELEHAGSVAETQFGAPVVVERTRVLPGPVSEAAWARMVAEARRAFGNPGAAGQVGATREWTAVGTGARRDLMTRLVAEPAGGGTRLVLHQSARGLAFGLHLSGLICAAVAVVTGVLALAGVDPAETAVACFLVTALAVAMLAGAQVGLRMWQARQDRKFEALLDRLELVAREGEAVPAASEPEALTPRLNPRSSLGQALDALPDATREAEDAVRPRHRTRL